MTLTQLAQLVTLHPILLVDLLAWSLFWKGFALWRAARRGHRTWFIILVIVNTLGILEILYLFVFSKPESPAAEA